MSVLIQKFNLYSREVEIDGFDLNFYPHDEECLVIIDVTKTNHSKSELTSALSSLLDGLRESFSKIEFFILPLFTNDIVEIQKSFLDYIKDTTERLLVIKYNFDTEITTLTWDIVSRLPDGYIVGSDKTMLIIPL